MEDKIDLSKVYFGIEQYIEIDDRGREHSKKRLYPYLLLCYFLCDKVKVYKFLNLETFEQVYMHSDGSILDYNLSSKENIINISGIHSFMECAQVLLYNFEEYGFDNAESIIDFDFARALFSDDDARFLDKSCIGTIINSTLTIYQLCYGNPISKESKMKCLYRYYNDIDWEE
jgi:hypothetical protein